LVNFAGLGVFVLGTVVIVARFGLVIVLRDWLWVWLLAGLLAVSLTDLRGWLRGVVVDWLPFIAVIVGYDLIRGVAEPALSQAHYAQQIGFDHLVFGGQLPTVWLQQRLWNASHRHVYDYLTWALYNSHFLVTVIVAAVLWRVNHERFLRFRMMVATLALSAMTTFAVFPTLPPWLAASDGRIPPVSRIIDHIWLHVGIKQGQAIFEQGARWSNEVAAWPSLHAAYPMLLLAFFWRRSRWWTRLGLATYVLAMGFAVVYSGEHYVFDVFGGWFYALCAFAVVDLAYRRLELRRRRQTLSVEDHGVLTGNPRRVEA
jgi:membrane-associated phospholipid phosphatase